MSSYQKKKDKKNAPGPGYRTSDHFKGSKFSSGGNKAGHSQIKNSPVQSVKTQHKG
jgi:hypothetical protein